MMEDIEVPYETFEHGADMGIRGTGKDILQAFENGARAMFSIMIENFSAVNAIKKINISCESFDIESLFTAWLNTLLAEADVNNLFLKDFKVTEIKDFVLKGSAYGEPFDPLRHKKGVEVKGATFTELKVFKKIDNEAWIAQCVVDV